MTHNIQLNDLNSEVELSSEKMAAVRGGVFSTAAALRAQTMTMRRYTTSTYSTARYVTSPYSTARYNLIPYSTARYTTMRWF